MGKLSRDKGKRWERAVATRMRDLFPASAGSIKRGWQTRSGRDGADVEGLPFRLWPEAKHGKLVGLREALRQAIEACQPGDLPVVVAKDDRSEPLALMRLADWETLIRRVRGEEV